MKRIVITRSNPVDPDSRVEKEANSLVKLGHDVTIVAWDRSENYSVKVDKKVINDCEVKRVRFGCKAEYGAGFKSLKPYLLFQLRLLKWLIRNRNEYDIGHFCDFDTSFTGNIAMKVVKKKFVFDLFDYLSTNPNSFFKRCIKRLEDSIINRADATIICTEQRKIQIKDTHPRKLVVIHNSPNDSWNKGKINIENNNRVKIVYVGVLEQKQRMLKELVEVVSQMSNVELHVGGFGELEEYMLQAKDAYDNIHFYGKIQYADTLTLEEQCDIITAIYNPIVGNSLFAAPNKFYEGLLLGKPLIMVKGTGMSDVVEEQEIGALIECNKSSLKKGIEELIDKRDQWNSMSEKMKSLYSTQYSWDEMEKRLDSLYRSI